MKKIAAILTACLLLAACNSSEPASPEQMSIEAVYSVDQSITSKSKTAAEIVAKLQSVRLVGCPADFVDAYKAYIKAWEKFTDIEKSLYAQNMQKGQSDVADFISTFVSNPTAAVVKLKKEWPAEADSIDKAAEGITKAFTNVTNIGTKYNAVYTRSSGLF